MFEGCNGSILFSKLEELQAVAYYSRCPALTVLVLAPLLDRPLIGVLDGRVVSARRRGMYMSWLLSLDDVFDSGNPSSGGQVKVIPKSTSLNRAPTLEYCSCHSTFCCAA